MRFCAGKIPELTRKVPFFGRTLNRECRIMTENLEIEKIKWDQYFEQALNDEGQEHDDTLWWKISDIDTIQIITDVMGINNSISVLEAGCGSGGSSFYLAEHIPVHLLRLSDVSEKALRFAKQCQPSSFTANVEYKKESAFDLKVSSGKFDLVWNVGVIEHYPLNELLAMIKEMLRVTKIGGYVIVAIPNRNSIAVMKAWFLGTKLGRKYFHFVPGYRFDTEILYKNKWLYSVLHKHFGFAVQIEFAGNLLWADAPNWLVKLTNKYFPQSRFSFLTFFIIHKQ